MQLGEFIKTKRKECGISLTSLSRLTNISQSYLSQIENGTRNPSLEKMKSLSCFLDVEYKELLNISNGLNVQDESINKIERIVFDLYKILNNENLLFKGEELSEKQKEKIKNIISIVIKD